jgi:hypothetical protein
MKAALMVCCLALASAAPAAAQSSEKYDPFRGIDCPPSGCPPIEEGLKDVYCSMETPTPPECSPEDVAKSRAWYTAREADLRRRYDEQQALPVPATKADLTLDCNGDTVQVWFQAGLLAWGMGEKREVWRLDRVTPTEITFKRVSYFLVGGGLFDAKGHIDRVSGQFLHQTGLPGYGNDATGWCKPAEPKF